MARTLLQAALTGIFCIGFALPIAQVLILSFASVFLGSLFAQTILRGWRAGPMDRAHARN